MEKVKQINILKLNKLLSPKYQVKIIDSNGSIELDRWIIWQNEKELKSKLEEHFDIEEFFDFNPDIKNDKFLSNGGFILKKFNHE